MDGEGRWTGHPHGTHAVVLCNIVAVLECNLMCFVCRACMLQLMIDAASGKSLTHAKLPRNLHGDSEFVMKVQVRMLASMCLTCLWALAPID